MEREAQEGKEEGRVQRAEPQRTVVGLGRAERRERCV